MNEEVETKEEEATKEPPKAKAPKSIEIRLHFGEPIGGHVYVIGDGKVYAMLATDFDRTKGRVQKVSPSKLQEVDRESFAHATRAFPDLVNQYFN